jgi:phosphoadenosine phosphosulfate reductase
MEGKKMKSLNTCEEHAPKPEWVADFFERQNDFLRDSGLGPNQNTKFKRFLSDSSLIIKNNVTDFSNQIKNIGWESESAWGLILVNLVYNNPQMRWYVDNMPAASCYHRKSIEEQLISLGQSEKMARAIIASFKRLCDLPLGTKLNFGTITEKGNQIETLTRRKSTLQDNRVVLYSLYKFAEACDNYYQFTLSRLLDHTVESAGISPTQIFGFERDDMERFLNGLSAKYPEFINATFTHDLDKITLREDKTSHDVLTLF